MISRYLQNNAIANRDLFDIYFLLQKSILPEESIIKIRTKKMLSKEMFTAEYLEYILSFIESNKEKIQSNIIFGLGDLI